jgi:hypothetical protein
MLTEIFHILMKNKLIAISQNIIYAISRWLIGFANNRASASSRLLATN